MDPTDALSAIETVLRNAVRLRFPHGAWVRTVGAPAPERLEYRRDEEAKRRDGATASSDLLDYAETHEITELIRKNWEDFKPIFDDFARTKTYFGIVLDVRNAIAHSRPLVHFERDLVSGIAGQLGNQLSIYQSTEDGSKDFYPTIQSLHDGFGAPGTRFPGDVSPVRRIYVGQEVHFSGLAVNPRDHPIEWFVARGADDEWGRGKVERVGSGEALEFDLKMRSEDVSEEFDALLFIRSRSRNHRNALGGLFVMKAQGGYDDYRWFRYSVNPDD